MATSNYINENGNPTVKWRGHSLTVVREGLGRIRAAQQALHTIQQMTAREVESNNKTVTEWLSPHLNIPAENIFISNGGECAESPTKTCIADDRDTFDKYDYTCIFCKDYVYAQK